MGVTSGQVLGRGRYEVVSRIGEGGGGVVYEVRDLRSHARLALKTVHVEKPESLASLKREFRAVQDIAHPNVVRLDELFEEGGSWFFTMELVDGIDWLSYAAPEGVLDQGRARRTIAELVLALAALHGTGTVHRDVKPSNVLVERSGGVKLLDFGVSARRRPIVSSADEGIVGTVDYMAPEQLLALEPTPAGDFYSVGVMLYEALTGDVPFVGRLTEAVRAKLAGPAVPVRQRSATAPSDLAALCDALLQANPKDRPDAPAILEALGVGRDASSGSLPSVPEQFVGRASELASLGEAFEAAGRGEAVTVVVEGPSGVGKSALVRRFILGLRGTAMVLEGRCHEREYVPYNGVDAIVDDLAEYLATAEGLPPPSPTSALLLVRLFPVLARVPAFAEAAKSGAAVDVDPNELRAWSFAAFRELIAELAGRRRLVLVIDDIQWMAGDTLALLGDLLAPPAPPVLLICTRRSAGPDSTGKGPQVLALPGRQLRIELGALPNAEVRELASQLSGETPLGDAQLTTVIRESGGHPLFLQELVRRQLSGASAMTNVRLDDVLWGRVAALPEAEQRVVEAVAISGAPTASTIIAAAANIPEGELPSSLSHLRAANLVRISGPSARQRVEPYHDRVREAVVAHLDARSLRDWHERLARALDASSERDVERLAVHWEGAGDASRAAELYREAADKACGGLAFDHAAVFYERAIALLDASNPMRRALELARADALFNGGRGRDAGRALLACAAVRDGRAAIELRSRAACAFLTSGHYAEGNETIRAAVAEVGLSFPRGRLATLFRILWYRFLLKLRGLAFTTKPFVEDELQTLRVDVCWWAAHGSSMTDTITGLVFHALGSRLSLDLGDPHRAARAVHGSAIGLSTGGLKTSKRTAEVIRAGRAIHALAPEPYTEAFGEAADGFLSFMLEDWKGARAHLERGETLLRDHCVGSTYELATLRMMLGRTLVQLGCLRDTDGYMGPLLRDAVRRNDLYAIANTRAGVGVFVALARDDVAGAEREAEQVASALSTQGFQVQHVLWLQARGNTAVYGGKPEAALALLEEHRGALRRSLLETVQSVRTGLVQLHARAHVALAARDAATREEHLKVATRLVRRLEREGLPACAAHALVVRAGVAHVRSEAGAPELLRDAVARFDAAGMLLHAASVRHVLAGLLEGDEATQLAARAADVFAEQRVLAPSRFAALYCPGFARR